MSLPQNDTQKPILGRVVQHDFSLYLFADCLRRQLLLLDDLDILCCRRDLLKQKRRRLKDEEKQMSSLVAKLCLLPAKCIL
jgi:hypothetical protein